MLGLRIDRVISTASATTNSTSSAAHSLCTPQGLGTLSIPRCSLHASVNPCTRLLKSLNPPSLRVPLHFTYPCLHPYTQFAIQDSGLFGPNSWKLLAQIVYSFPWTAAQPLEQILDSDILLCELGVNPDTWYVCTCLHTIYIHVRRMPYRYHERLDIPKYNQISQYNICAFTNITYITFLCRSKPSCTSSYSDLPSIICKYIRARYMYIVLLYIYRERESK